MKKLTIFFPLSLFLVFNFQNNALASEQQATCPEYGFSGLTVVRHHYKEVGSTQNKIEDHSDEISPEKWVVVSADSQTEGIGMWGRKWTSPAGNVFVTYAIHLEKDQNKFMICAPWIAGVALINTLESYGLTPQLRWINNATIENKKIGGILCRGKFTNGRAILYVGVGINVSLTELQCRQIDQPATSFALELEKAPEVEEVIKRLTSNIYKSFYQLNEKKISSIFDEYKSALSLVGKEVEIFDGKERYKGLFKRVVTEPITKMGQLILENEKGEEITFPSGEIAPPKKS